MASDLQNSMQSDLHGLEINPARKCDYCGGDIDTRNPVQCEVVRIGEMPNLKSIIAAADFSAPTGWGTDSLRCRNCRTDSISPATDGFGEALVKFRITDTSGRVAVDASEMEVIDASPDGSGYYPPNIDLDLLLESEDPGLFRWSRLEMLLENQHASERDTSPVVERVRQFAATGKEVPPEIATLLG
jgi:hypothetical protein